MTKEQFLSIEINQISQCYIGKDNACRCGCSGTYTYTSYHATSSNRANDKLALKQLKRAKKLVNQGANYEIDETYINIETGKNRALTLYFDDIK
jgi:hypothetical protein